MKTIIIILSLASCIMMAAHAQPPPDTTSAEYTLVEQMPEYPGGQDALLEYLKQINYLREARKKDMEGSVYARFVVEKNGRIGQVEIAKSSGYGMLDSLVIEHLQNMPRWTPGTQEGKPVRVQYVVPVKFKLQ